MANPIGIDPATCFLVEAKIEGFCNKQDDGRKIYYKGRTLRWVVDSDRFSLCELISYLSDEINWGNCHKPRIWGMDDVELVSESQILQLFTKYEKERNIPLRVVASDIVEGTKCSATETTFPCTPIQSVPAIANGSQSQHGSCDPDENVTMQPEALQPDQPDEEKNDSKFEPEEYVGLDDEFLYKSDSEEGNAQHGGSSDADFIGDENVQDSNIDDTAHCEPAVIHDLENPKIEVGALFPNVTVFRKALRHFAIKQEFEFVTIKSDKTRFIGKCKFPSCKWRIHASVLQEEKTCMVKVLGQAHSCPSTSMVDGTMASQSWVSDMVSGWLAKNPSIGAKAVKEKLEDEFNVKVTYGKAWCGRNLAVKQVHGSWDENFELIYNFKHELERRSPGSIVEVDCKRIGNKMVFSKVFVALKPCVDGWLNGCRPYLAIDSTHLTGMYTGQLAAACGIDGHNWLFSVAYGIFDSESTESWVWFMQHLRKAIGNPPDLAISSDASKGLGAASARVFPEAEHRECMRHLMKNFKKKFHGKDFICHMWGAAKAYDVRDCELHLERVKELSAAAIDWLNKNHNQLWCKSKFSDKIKCDYVNNNISESFNSWIREFKGLHIVDLIDHIRQLIMIKFDIRRKISTKFEGEIIPSVLRELNALSRSGKHKIYRSGDNLAEVSGVDSEGKIWRHVVELDKHECTCREWQITGKPCLHAVKFICSMRGSRIEQYVHEYYSVHKFRSAYAGYVTPMPAKSRWVKVDPGFKVHPPQMKRPAGRPRKQRIPSCLEPGSKKHQCKRCKQYGHQQRTCKEPVTSDSRTAADSGPIRKRKRTLRTD